MANCELGQLLQDDVTVAMDLSRETVTESQQGVEGVTIIDLNVATAHEILLTSIKEMSTHMKECEECRE